MRLLRQFQDRLSFFFMKMFETHKKHQNAKQVTFTFLEVCARKKNIAFVVFVSLFLFCWLMFACECFVCVKSFCKKKKNLRQLNPIHKKGP